MHSQGEYAAAGGQTITASAIDSNKKQANAIRPIQMISSSYFHCNPSFNKFVKGVYNK